MARQSFNAAHIELRHKTFYAVLYVPKDVQHILRQTKFTRSTRTGDRSKAEAIAAKFVLGWKIQISEARLIPVDPLIREAKDLLILKRRDTSPGLVTDVIDQRAYEISQSHGAGVASDFQAIASGEKTLSAEYISKWRVYQEDRGLKVKTLDQQEADIKSLTETFYFTEDIDDLTAKEWIKTIALSQNSTASSITRIVGSCKSFYKYLQMIGAVNSTAKNPFVIPDEFKRSKRTNAKSKTRIQSWIGFEPEDVVIIYKEALKREDSELANLIKIAAYTGARIEEICSLKCSDINIKKGSISIKDAKTPAGNRTIPIHTEIKGLIKILLETSSNEYLLPNLTFNKYNNRSNAIGKRFGRLKTTMGFGNLHVFHSIRKTLITLLENARVPENIAADIVGHDKQTMTYGTYSGGAILEVMREALEKAKYEFPKD